MEKEKLREIVKKSVEDVWYNRRSMNPVADQTELLTEALHQALSMSGVVGRSESVFCNCDLPALIGNSVTQEVICVKCKRPPKN